MPRNALAVKSDKIDRIEQERRETAVAHGVGDDLARKRKQKARALDQDDRLDAVRRHVLDAKDAGKDELEVEQQRPCNSALPSRRNAPRRRSGSAALGVDVDLDVDARLLAGRVG